MQLRSFTRACGFVWKYSPLLACCNDSADAVIPCTGTLDDRRPSLLPFPIDGSGQLLLPPESTSLHTVQVQIDKDGEEAVLAGQNTGSLAVNGDGILHPSISSCLTPSSFFPLSGARTHILPSRLPALMMAFFSLLTSPHVFLPLLPSGARVRLNMLLLHTFLARDTGPLGRIPFPVLLSPLPSFLHLLL